MYEGSVLDLGDGVARALIARGVAEPHDGSPGAANKSMSTEQRAKAVRKKVAG